MGFVDILIPINGFSSGVELPCIRITLGLLLLSIPFLAQKCVVAFVAHADGIEDLSCSHGTGLDEGFDFSTDHVTGFHGSAPGNLDFLETWRVVDLLDLPLLSSNGGT